MLPCAWGGLPNSTRTARRIASGRQVVLGSPAYFARVGEPAAPGDLVTHEAVIYAQKGGGADWTFKRDGVDIAVTLKGRLRVSAAEGVRAAVLADAGIAITSSLVSPACCTVAAASTYIRSSGKPITKLAPKTKPAKTARAGDQVVAAIIRARRPPASRSISSPSGSKQIRPTSTGLRTAAASAPERTLKFITTATGHRLSIDPTLDKAKA